MAIYITETFTDNETITFVGRVTKWPKSSNIRVIKKFEDYELNCAKMFQRKWIDFLLEHKMPLTNKKLPTYVKSRNRPLTERSKCVLNKILRSKI